MQRVMVDNHRPSKDLLLQPLPLGTGFAPLAAPGAAAPKASAGAASETSNPAIAGGKVFDGSSRFKFFLGEDDLVRPELFVEDARVQGAAWAGAGDGEGGGGCGDGKFSPVVRVRARARR